jgi:hypothetical protein
MQRKAVGFIIYPGLSTDCLPPVHRRRQVDAAECLLRVTNANTSANDISTSVEYFDCRHAVIVANAVQTQNFDARVWHK